MYIYISIYIVFVLFCFFVVRVWLLIIPKLLIQASGWIAHFLGHFWNFQTVYQISTLRALNYLLEKYFKKYKTNMETFENSL